MLLGLLEEGVYICRKNRYAQVFLFNFFGFINGVL
jgi:hypothetical protein